MYVKLILRNARRSARDYLIYLITLTLCVAMFYAFMSVTSSHYHPEIGAEFDMGMLAGGVKLAVRVIACLTLFLMGYVNKYMIRRRQKEFALQTVMGMERGTTAMLFFAETMCMGLAALLAGILLGALLSQFITAALLSAYGRAYKVSIMLFPDTIGTCILFFMLCFVVTGVWNIHVIRKIPVVEMFAANRVNEKSLQKHKWMPVLTIFYVMILVSMARIGYVRGIDYYDSRHPFPVRAVLAGIVAAPVLSLAAAALYCIISLLRRKGFALHRLVVVLNVTMLPVIVVTALLPVCRIRYFMALGQDTMNLYMLCLAGCISYLICSVIYLASFVVAALKGKRAHCYKEENLFFFGQILSKLGTTVKSMSVIALTLAFSIGLFMAELVLSGWAQGYLEKRSVFEVQMISYYNAVREPEDIVLEDYAPIITYLEEQGVEITKDCLLTMYLPRREDFHKRVKYEFPATAVRLSEYNLLRDMRGLEPVTLDSGEFLMQWDSIATDDEIGEHIRQHTEIETDAGTLRLAEDGICEADIGELVYNSHVDVIYVFPDAVCDGLLGVGSGRFLDTAAPIPYDVVETLEPVFEQQYPYVEGGSRFLVRARSEQVNSSIASVFVMKVGMIYSAVILMVSCLTVLALQQLYEADCFGYRFDVLRKLGVEDSRRDRLILRQIAFWFGLPVLTAVLAGGIFTYYLCVVFSAQITAYIGNHVLLARIGATGLILSALLVCYFGATWLLFRQAVKNFE